MIHPAAVVERGAELGRDVDVGPYAVLRAGARVGDGTSVGPHALIEGRTFLGARNRVAAFAALGGAPQHRGYRGEHTRLVIGDDNDLREFVTLHRGTEAGGGVTRVGSRCMVMAYAHVAHDASLGDEVTLANGVQLAGHVRVEDCASLGGLSAAHQFARVGRWAMVAAGAMVSQDVPPWCMAAGDRARLVGLNRVGLERAGVPSAARRALRRAYRALFLEGLPLAAALDRLAADPTEEVRTLAEFVRASGRGVCRAR